MLDALAKIGGIFNAVVVVANDIFFFWNGYRILHYFANSTQQNHRTRRLVFVPAFFSPPLPTVLLSLLHLSYV